MNLQPNSRAVRRFRSAFCAAIALGAAGSAQGRQPALVSPTGCPVAAWSFDRWNDAYGLNVAGFVQAYPGWVYSFDRKVTVIRAPDGPDSEVEITLRPAPMDRRHPPKTSDQHVYGYWPHSELRLRPNWVLVRCGRSAFTLRTSSRPWESFNREPPAPPPTFPPPPPAGD